MDDPVKPARIRVHLLDMVKPDRQPGELKALRYLFNRGEMTADEGFVRGMVTVVRFIPADKLGVQSDPR